MNHSNMENIPDVIIEKIEDYVVDLFRKDHVKKFESTLNSLKRINAYIRTCWAEGKCRWKIRYTNGTYRILRYLKKDVATHWVNVPREFIEKDDRLGSMGKVGFEWDTLLGVF